MTKEEVIKTLHELWRETNDSWYEEAFDMAIEALKDRPQGKWVSNRSGYWKCSECGIRVAIYGKGNYCPNCGADMRNGVM